MIRWWEIRPLGVIAIVIVVDNVVVPSYVLVRNVVGHSHMLFSSDSQWLALEPREFLAHVGENREMENKIS